MRVRLSKHSLVRMNERLPGAMLQVGQILGQHLDQWDVSYEPRGRISFVAVVRKRRIRFVLARIGMNDFLLITVVVV